MLIKHFKTGIILFAFVIFCPPLQAASNFFHNYTHFFSYDDVFTTGLKLDLSFAKGTFSTTFKKHNFGISLFSENYLKNVPIELSFGNISIGGIISKMKDPEIDSTTTGFDSCLSDITILNCTLPSFTLFSKPLSSFVEVGYENEKTVFQIGKINGTYNLNSGEIAFSTVIGLKACKNITFQSASCMSLYNLKENSQTSWYAKKPNLPYYSSDKNLTFCTQFSGDFFDFYKCVFSVFLYETPFSQIKPVFKLENKIEGHKIKGGIVAYFNNQEQIITPDNKLLAPCAVIKSNLNFEIPIKEKKLGLGITAFYKNSFFQIDDNLKTAIGFKFSNNYFNFYMEESFTNEINKEKKQLCLKYFSGKLINTWKLKYCSPSFGISARFYLKSKSQRGFILKPEISSHSYSITTSFDILNNLLYGNSSYSFSCKNNEFYNKKLKLGLTFTGSFKKIIIIMKINGEFCI